MGPIPEPTLDQIERFRAALNTLRLQPTLHDLQKGQGLREKLEAAGKKSLKQVKGMD